MSSSKNFRIVGGRVYARVRFGKGDRIDERLPWASPADEAAIVERSALIRQLCGQLIAAGRRDRVKATAKEIASATSSKVLETIKRAVAVLVRIGSQVAPGAEYRTFGDVAEAWVDGTLAARHPDYVKTKTSYRLERGRLDRYILPLVKDVPITAFEAGHADLVMSKLPPKRIKTSSARRHIAQIMSRVMHLAVHPLRLITASPLGRGFLPRITRSKHYTCLFPKEEAKLLACAEVDEAFRLFIGVLDREGMRISELVDSEWWQWNLEEGTFTVTRSKTGDPRMWALRPDTAHAMRLWHDRYGKTLARPFVGVAHDQASKDTLAARLREALKTAGVTRKELHESTEHTGALRAHDMRATFVTISLAEGRQETWIRDHTAHKTTSMIDRYRRAARQFAELKVGPLGDLVAALGWGMTWGMAGSEDAAETELTAEEEAEFRRKDSNLRKRNQNPLSCH